MAKKKEVTIEDLAGMVQRGFSDVAGQINDLTGQIKKVQKRMDVLERGQEDIKLRLDNVAYRFELKELENRVKILERKLARA